MAKETRIIAGKSIQNMQGYNTWITCTLDTGERFTISFKVLYDLFDRYEFKAERIGNRFRATKEFKSVEELDAEEEKLSPLIYIEKLSEN